MNLSDLKDKVTLELATQPQRQAKAIAGVDSIAAGIAELSALGYRVAVVEEIGAQAPAAQEYPKMLFRQGLAPTEVTVEDEEGEADARKKGYSGQNEAPPLAPPPPTPAVDSVPQNPASTPVVKPAPAPVPAPIAATPANTTPTGAPLP